MAITVGLWQFPFGPYVLYPFTILATWFHEMGHGLTSLLLGGEFNVLILYPNGSGLANAGSESFGPIRHSLVAAGGPIAPALVGAGLIYASKSEKMTRIALLSLAVAIWLSAIIWIRSLTGLIVVPAVGIAIALIVAYGKQWMRALTVQFLGLNAFISMFSAWDYLFTHTAYIGGEALLSDTGQMSEALGGPHWFWAGVIVAIGGAILLASLHAVYGTRKR